LTVISFADVPAVAIALSRTSPAPETAAFLLFFADRALALCKYNRFVTIGAWSVDTKGSGAELGVEGVEDIDRRRATTALLLAFPRFLSMG
jgi:hypothetical protein